jgi:hypothetical protein
MIIELRLDANAGGVPKFDIGIDGQSCGPDPKSSSAIAYSCLIKIRIDEPAAVGPQVHPVTFYMR